MQQVDPTSSISVEKLEIATTIIPETATIHIRNALWQGNTKCTVSNDSIFYNDIFLLTEEVKLRTEEKFG